MAIGRQITLTPNIASKVISATATASQKQFTVTGGYRVDELAVYRNGIRLVNGRDYTATDGLTVALTEGAVVSDIFEFQIFDSFNIADAIDSNSADQTINGNLTVSGKLTTGSGTTVSYATTSFGLEGTPSITVASITGAASTLSGVTKITNSTASTSSSTGALIVTGGVGIGKSLFVSEGISVGGTITYDDVTNIDSVGFVTAGKGFRATTGGIVVTAGVSTFAAALDVNSSVDVSGGVNLSAGNLKVTAGIVTIGAGLTLSSDFIHLGDNKKIQLGIASDFTIQHNATNSVINNTTGQLRIAGDDVRIMNKDEDETYAIFSNDGAATLYYDNSKIIETVSSGASVYGALKLQNGLLRENVNRNTSAAANAATALNLDNGMVHWFTTNLGAANVKMNVVSGVGINTDLAIGDMISVTIMTAVNSTSNFIEQVRVDGVEASAGVTTYWTGGSAPTDGGGSGVDSYAFNIVKTGNGTYDMIANQVKGS